MRRRKIIIIRRQRERKRGDERKKKNNNRVQLLSLLFIDGVHFSSLCSYFPLSLFRSLFMIHLYHTHFFPHWISLWVFFFLKKLILFDTPLPFRCAANFTSLESVSHWLTRASLCEWSRGVTKNSPLLLASTHEHEYSKQHNAHSVSSQYSFDLDVETERSRGLKTSHFLCIAIRTLERVSEFLFLLKYDERKINNKGKESAHICLDIAKDRIERNRCNHAIKNFFYCEKRTCLCFKINTRQTLARW
jgi:hypothetical protein